MVIQLKNFDVGQAHHTVHLYQAFHALGFSSMLVLSLVSVILHTSGSSTSLHFRITWEALGNSHPKAVFQKPINIYFLGVKTK